MKISSYLIVMLAMYLFACSPPPEICPSETTATIYFLKNTSPPYYHDAYSFAEISKIYSSVHGEGNTKEILADTSNPTHFRLPLDVSKDSSTYILEGNTRRDTIVIQYERLITKCGRSKDKNERFIMNLTKMNIGKHTFDSVSTNNYYGSENDHEISVYF